MMKTLFLTTLYMGFSFVVLASADPSPAKPESCLVAPVLAKHLPNGVWLGTSADGQKLSVVFYENGVAQWNEGAGQVPEVALYGWEVIPGVGGCAFLQMTGQASGNTYSYAVDVKCNQLQLIATDFSAHSLKQIKAGNVKNTGSCLAAHGAIPLTRLKSPAAKRLIWKTLICNTSFLKMVLLCVNSAMATGS